MPYYSLVIAGEELELTKANGIYGIRVSGGGMPPVENITSRYALMDGALWQRAIVRSRLVTLTLLAHASTLPEFRAIRSSVVAAINGHIANTLQLRYYHDDLDYIYLTCVYDAGMQEDPEAGPHEWIGLRLLAVDPYWYDNAATGAALNVRQVTANAEGIFELATAKTYNILDGGLHWPANPIVVRKVVRYGEDIVAIGQFYTAGSVPVAVNGIARWDITGVDHWEAFEPSAGDWAALSLPDGGTGVFTDVVFYDLAVDALGNLYVTARGLDLDYYNVVWKWNGAAWSALDHGNSTENAPGLILAISPQNGYLYSTRITVAAAEPYGVQYWNGAAWVQVGAALIDEELYSLAVGIDGKVYVGGYFTTVDGVATKSVAMWNGAAWVVMAAGLQKAAFPHVYGLAIGSDGRVYAGGDFTDDGTTNMLNVAVWNGNKWSPMGAGLDDVVRSMLYDETLGLIATGKFNASGGVDILSGVAQWHDNLWIDGGTGAVTGGTDIWDIDLTGGVFILGGIFNGTITTYGLTTLTNVGTANSYPIITLTGPGRVHYITNFTTNQVLIFDLLLLAGEIVTINLLPGVKTMTSNFRGSMLYTLVSGSLVNWHLAPGVNSVGAFVDDAAAVGACSFLQRWLSSDMT